MKLGYLSLFQKSKMEETLGAEGRYYLEEVSLTDEASSRGTISPLPMKVKPTGEYPVNDGKFITVLKFFKQSLTFAGFFQRLDAYELLTVICTLSSSFLLYWSFRSFFALISEF